MHALTMKIRQEQETTRIGTSLISPDAHDAIPRWSKPTVV